MTPRENMRTWSDERLRGTLQFLDCDRLRGYYTGLIAAVREEQRRRARETWRAAAAAADSAKPPGSA